MEIGTSINFYNINIRELILKKFEEINYYDGILLFDEIIKKDYNETFINFIIISLIKNKKKHTCDIYDHIIKTTDFDYDSCLDYPIDDKKIIHLCAEYRNFHLMNYLINNGVDVNTRTNKYGKKTPLMLVCDNALMYECDNFAYDSSSVKIVKLLIEKGADINLTDNLNNKALNFISKNITNNYSVIVLRLLLEHKDIDINHQNKFGNNAFNIVILSNLINDFPLSELIELLELMIFHGSDINQEYKCSTPLGLILKNPRPSKTLVRFLLEKGATLGSRINNNEHLINDYLSKLHLCDESIKELIRETLIKNT